MQTRAECGKPQPTGQCKQEMNAMSLAQTINQPATGEPFLKLLDKCTVISFDWQLVPTAIFQQPSNQKLREGIVVCTAANIWKQSAQSRTAAC